jgi:Icc-related predicted phosphoesterase
VIGTRVVHFSDWHGDVQPLPSSDVYVCTGDMLPNTRACMWADKEPERYFQRNWIKANKGAYAKMFKPKSTILVVRGNHDYVDLAPLFEGHHVIELKGPERVEIDGIGFAGFRGVPPICGEWADEMSETELDHRCSALTDVDVLVTHAAAYGRCDADYGSRALRGWLTKRRPPWHLHGHIHEAKGGLELEGTHTSNAATTVRMLEIVT